MAPDYFEMVFHVLVEHFGVVFWTVCEAREDNSYKQIQEYQNNKQNERTEISYGNVILSTTDRFFAISFIISITCIFYTLVIKRSFCW